MPFVLLVLCASLAAPALAAVVSEIVLCEADPNITSGFVASPDGRRLAWIERTEARMRVVLDGSAGPYYQAVSNLVFSEDGYHLTYVVQTDRPPVPGVDQAVVRDGEPGEFYERVTTPQMDLHGRMLAYFAKRERSPVVLVVDGSYRRPDDTVIEGSLALSREGGRFAFIVKRKGWYHMATDVGLRGSYKSMTLSDVRFSPDGEHLSFTVDAVEPMLVIDGAQVGYYERLLGPVYDSVGKSTAYALRYDDLWRVFIKRPAGTTEFETRDDVSELLLSPSGEHFAYARRTPLGRTSVMLDTVPVGEYDEAGGLTFSPDGRHVAFTVEEGNRFRVVFKGVTSGLYESVRGLVVGPGGEHWACWEESRGKSRVVVDGVKGKSYDAALSRIVFDNEHQLHYVARRRNTYVRVNVSSDR